MESTDQGQAAAPASGCRRHPWFTQRVGGKIGHLDPETGKIKEYDLPGPSPSPYAIGIDRNHMIWYDSFEQDTLGRLDPRTGEITEFPFPHPRRFPSENFSWILRAACGSEARPTIRSGYFYFNEDADAVK